MRAKQQSKREQPGPVAPPREASPQLPQMLRVKQVAELLGVSTKTVQVWFRKRAVVVQGPHKATMLIPRRVLDDWIREHTNSR
jgi:phage terminase Nu1 subunit (DNA packaging protein)